jgi:hypothetical protein
MTEGNETDCSTHKRRALVRGESGKQVASNHANTRDMETFIMEWAHRAEQEKTNVKQPKEQSSPPTGIGSRQSLSKGTSIPEGHTKGICGRDIVCPSQEGDRLMDGLQRHHGPQICSHHVSSPGGQQNLRAHRRHSRHSQWQARSRGSWLLCRCEDLCRCSGHRCRAQTPFHRRLFAPPASQACPNLERQSRGGVACVESASPACKACMHYRRHMTALHEIFITKCSQPSICPEASLFERGARVQLGLHGEF